MRLLLVVVIAFGVAISEASHVGSHLRTRKEEEACSLRDSLMNPIHEVRYGQDTVWQVPPVPKGVLFLAHGLDRDPFGYFDKAPGCEKCYGLPEDRSIALEALRRGYAVIAIKSIGAHFDTSLDSDEDLVKVISIITDIRREHSVDSRVPFVAFGASAGGKFVTILATKIPTAALLLMITQGHPEVVKSATRENFPPTFFAYMNASDAVAIEMGTTRAGIEEVIAILSERGVSVGWKLCLPRPIPPLYFTERLPCTSDEASAKMQKAYKSAGRLDDQNYLKEDPHSWDWLAPLPRSSWPYWYVPSTGCAFDPVCQELLSAWAYHVTTGDANEEMFSWLDSILTSSDDDDQVLLSDSR
jgi:hypothetical protein